MAARFAARGCDDSGGDGTPAVFSLKWGFNRVLNTPGLVAYDDELSGARGLIVVLGGPGLLVVNTACRGCLRCALPGRHEPDLSRV
jgi:hypothetical protein